MSGPYTKYTLNRPFDPAKADPAPRPSKAAKAGKASKAKPAKPAKGTVHRHKPGPSQPGTHGWAKKGK
jgi:hypothetical protein